MNPLHSKAIAQAVVDYLNSLIELDKVAVGALIGLRVPCNEKLADHPTCQVTHQHGGFLVGLLGMLNGICGCDQIGGFIVAEFTSDKKGYQDLIRFKVRESLAVDEGESDANERV